VGLTPFLFVFLPVALTSAVVTLPCAVDFLATVLLPRPLIQPPAPTRHMLVSPLHVVLLLRMCVKTFFNIRSNSNPSGEMAA
jgi:hypothetical protein